MTVSISSLRYRTRILVLILNRTLSLGYERRRPVNHPLFHLNSQGQLRTRE